MPTPEPVNDSEMQEKVIENMNKEIQEMKKEFLDKNNIVNDQSEHNEEPNQESLEHKVTIEPEKVKKKESEKIQKEKPEKVQKEEQKVIDLEKNPSEQEDTEYLDEPLVSEGSIKLPNIQSDRSKVSR
jgi:hypothetical protein